MGAIAATGYGLDAFWSALIEGRSGVRPITFFDTTPYKTKIAGEIPNFEPLRFIDERSLKYMDRVCQISMAAAAEATTSGGLDPESGLVFGTGVGGISTSDKQHEALFKVGPQMVRPLDIPMIMCNAAASHLSMRYGLKGPGYTVVTACASGSNAIGEAYRLIKHGYADAILTGGADSTISSGIFYGWNKLRVMSKRNDAPGQACRPFSKDRDGMVLAEGAGVLILEEMERAKRRGATIWAEIVGYGSSQDATHITAPNIEGQVLAMERALNDAKVSPAEVDYINAHGTATAANDKAETESIKRAFGEQAYKTPVSSIKAVTGHSLGGCGALEAIACCLALRDNLMPPTINYTEPDPDCDLDYVPNQAREKKLETIMSNSFGFGGNNAVLVFRKA
jgi:3-oxoacyl-[acyl-carrier-protein] synthase II